MQQNERIRYMDILKGLAIIMVVMGHCDAKGGKLIYLFHMPLFFFISGYFYNEKYSPKILIKKRIKSLYLPFIKYEIIFLVFHNIFYKLNLYNLQSSSPVSKYSLNDILINLIHIGLFDGTEMLLSPFWFLACLFIVTIIFCMILNITNKLKLKEIVTALIVIILLMLGELLTKMNINIVVSPFCKEIFNVSLVALFFFYIGFIYKKCELKIAISSKIAFIAFIILCISAKMNFKVDMRINYYSNFLVFVVDAILGIYFMLTLIKKLDKLKFEFIFLKYAGKNTITIMALQLICFKIISIIQVKLYNLPINSLSGFGNIYNKNLWWIAYTIIGVILPCIIKYAYDMLKKFYNCKRYNVCKNKKYKLHN